jgi:hypothetical protein
MSSQLTEAYAVAGLRKAFLLQLVTINHQHLNMNELAFVVLLFIGRNSQNG